MPYTDITILVLSPFSSATTVLQTSLQTTSHEMNEEENYRIWEETKDQNMVVYSSKTELL